MKQFCVSKEKVKELKAKLRQALKETPENFDPLITPLIELLLDSSQFATRYSYQGHPEKTNGWINPYIMFVTTERGLEQLMGLLNEVNTTCFIAENGDQRAHLGRFSFSHRAEASECKSKVLRHSKLPVIIWSAEIKQYSDYERASLFLKFMEIAGEWLGYSTKRMKAINDFAKRVAEIKKEEENVKISIDTGR